MPPPNTTFATAIDLGTLPADVTVNVHDAGLNSTVYYKFTAPVGVVEIGAWGFSPLAETFRAQLMPYLGPAGAPTSVLGITALNVPLQFPVTAGQEYFLELTKQDDTAPATIRLQVEIAPTAVVTQGDFLINDDGLVGPNTGWPLAVASGQSDYTIKRFLPLFPAGEAGDVLSSGLMLFEDWANSTIVVYDTTFTVQATYAGFGPGFNAVQIRTCHSTPEKFYVGHLGSPAEVTTVEADGSLGPKTWMVPGVFFGTLAADLTHAILYFTEGNVLAPPIKRYDLVAEALLTDFVPGIPVTVVCDILVLRDGTILGLFEDVATGQATAKHWQPDGTELLSYDFGINERPNGTVTRLAYALDDPISFWIWTHPPVGISRFLNVRVSDGAILATRDHASYTTGKSDAPETATPSSRFGVSTSCPFIIAPFGGPVIPPLPSPCPVPNPDPGGGTVCRSSILGGGS